MLTSPVVRARLRRVNGVRLLYGGCLSVFSDSTNKHEIVRLHVDVIDPDSDKSDYYVRRVYLGRHIS